MERSDGKRQTVHGKILKPYPQPDRHGHGRRYPCVVVSYEGQQRKFFIDQLLRAVFGD